MNKAKSLNSQACPGTVVILVVQVLCLCLYCLVPTQLVELCQHHSSSGAGGCGCRCCAWAIFSCILNLFYTIVDAALTTSASMFLSHHFDFDCHMILSFPEGTTDQSLRLFPFCHYRPILQVYWNAPFLPLTNCVWCPLFCQCTMGSWLHVHKLCLVHFS